MLLNKKQRLSIVVSITLLFMPMQAIALPTGASVASGSVTINTTQNEMVINASDKAIINYNSFNIGANELVKFVQPNSNAVVLNRVVLANPSSILGTLSANGNVFLVNPAGIFFGANSVVNANSFLATTLNISDEDFLKGNYHFEQIKNLAPSYIIQRGMINVSPEGFVILAAPFVSSEGAIIAKSGKVVIGATDNFYIHFDANGLINYTYDKSTSSDSPIILPAETADNIINNIINTGTASNAIKMVKNGDQIELVGADNTALVSSNINTDAVDGKSAGSIIVDGQKQAFVFDGAKLSSNAADVGNGGNILIYSNDLTYSDHGASYIANGGLLNGDGGFLEISADKSVIFGGSEVSLYAVDGKRGVFYIDPEDGIEITDDTVKVGADAVWTTDGSFIVDSGVTISTRDIDGDDYENAESQGSSGNIEINANSIILEAGSKLLSFADNGYASGDITLNAVGSSGDVGLEATSSININGATIKGGNINISASSSSANEFTTGNDLVDYALDFLTSSADDTPPLVNVGLSIAQSKATINIGSGSNIEGSSVNIQSSASSTASVSVAASGVSVGYGKTTADAETIIQNGATIISSGDINIKSSSVSDNSVEAYTEEAEDSDGAKINVNLAYATSSTTSKAIIEDGADIDAGGVLNVNAYTEKSMDVSADDGANEDSSLGASVAIGTSDSTTQASVGGNINADNLIINAQTDNDVLKTAAYAGAENPSAGDVVSNVEDGLSEKIQDWVSDKMPSFESEIPATEESSDGTTTTSSPLGLSAAFAYSDHTSTTTADIAANSNVNINQDTDIEALNNYLTSDNGESGIKTVAMAAVPSSEDSTTVYSAAGAVAVTNLDNTVNAYVDDGATLNSKGNIAVSAKTEMPYQISWDDVTDVSDIPDKVNSALDITKTSFFTTWAQSSAAGEMAGIAGSVNYFHMKNDTEAYLGENTQINQGQSDYGTLSVNALTNIETMNLAGVVGLTDSSGNGLGGSYLDIQYDDTTKAEIRDNSNILTKQLSVEANTNTKNISIAASGGNAEQYGIAGSVSYLKINNVTQANINNANLVVTGDSSTDGIDLLSSDYSKLFNVTGGVMLSTSVGIGASVSINEIDRDTEANLNGTGFDNTGVTNIGSLNSGEIDAVSLAGAVTTTFGTQKPQDSMAGQFGIGLSGSVSLNRINDTTTAAITGSNNQANQNNANDIDIAASNTSNIKSFAGAVSAVTAIKTSAGLAGAYSQNDLNNKTSASIDSSTIYAKTIKIDSSSKGEIDSYTASCSGSLSLGLSVSIAGSVSINNISNDITADITNGSDVTAGGSVSLSAEDSSTINTKAGGIAISGAGIGAAFSKNSISNDIYAYVSNSGITADSLNISSVESATINALSASLGIGAEGLAVSAAIVINDIADDIEAYINNNSKTVSANGDINILANDGSSIDTQAGQAAGSDGAAIGLSTLYNTISNEIDAFISNATVNNGGNIIISSVSDKSISAKAAGAAVSGSASAAGAVVINTIKDTMNSYISYSSVVAENSISILSEEKNVLTAMSGILSVGVALGADGSIVTNIIENTIKSYIFSSSVKADGNAAVETLKSDLSGDTENINGIDILASASEKIESDVANLSGSGSTSVAASVSVNLLRDSIDSYIDSSNINSDNDNANALQQVRVRAVSYNDIKSNIGGLAIGGDAGIGASSDTSMLQNTLNAYIQNSNVYAKKAVNVNAQSLEYLNSVVVSGGFSGGASLAGSAAVINVDNHVNAYILNSNVNSEGDLGVSASDTTKLGTLNNETKQGILAGGTGIGLVAGVGGSVVVTSVTQNTNAYAQDSILNAKGIMSILADNYADTITFAATGSVGAFAGAAGSVTINTIDSTAKAYTYASGANKMLINQDDNYKTSVQDVKIQSKNHSSIDSSPGAGSDGAVGVSGSIDVATIHNTSSAKLGDYTLLNAGRDFLISAEAYKSVTSEVSTLSGSLAEGVSGSVSIANINTNINDDALDASKDTKDKTDTLISKSDVGDQIGDSDTATSAKSEIDAETTSLNVDNAFDPDYVPNETTQAAIGDNSVLNVGGATSVETSDTTSLDLISGGISVSGVLGIGGAVSIANVGADTKAYIGKNVNINTGSLNINSNLILNKNSIKSYAGAAGSVGLGAAVSEFNVNYTNEAYTDSGSVLTISKGDFNIAASSDLSSNSVTAYGAAIGAAAAGIVKAEFIQKGSTTAIVKSSKVDTTGNINISASDNEYNSSSLAQAAAGGILSGTGSFSDIELTPTLIAGFGDGVISTSSGDTSILSSSIATLSSEADGVDVSLGGLTVGLSKAVATWTPTLTSTVGSDNNIKANNFYMKAFENTDDNGNYFTDNTIDAKAFSAVGESLVGGTGSLSEATRNANILSVTGDNTQISTNGDIYINSKAFGKTQATSNGFMYSALAAGATEAVSTSNANVGSVIGDDNVLNAGRDISINAYAGNEALSNTLGGTGGLLTTTGTIATTNINANIYTNIEAGASLLAGENIGLNALSYVNAHAVASIVTGSAVTYNQTETNVNVNQNVEVNVKENAELKAKTINILAEVTSFEANSHATSETVAADSNSEAYANVDATSNTNININSGATLNAAYKISVISKQDKDNIFLSKTDSNATIDAGVTGSLRAYTDNEMHVNSNANFESGSKLITTDLYVQTYAPEKDADTYVNVADTTSHTVVTWVLTQTKKLVDVVSNIPIIGWIVKKVWKVVDEWVPQFTNSTQVSKMSGDYYGSSVISMNSEIYQESSVSQALNIAADGTITAQGGDISAQTDGDNIVVNDLINHDKGLIELNSNGQITGTSDIYIQNVYPDVTINNYSNKNLELNNINVESDNANEPNLQMSYVPSEDVVPFIPVYHSMSVDHSVNINNYGSGDVVFNGVVSNYGGETSVYNSYGNIYSNSGALLLSKNININAVKGSIGSSENPVEIELQKSDSDNPSITTNSFYDTYLGLKLSELTDVPLNEDYVIDGLDLSNIKTEGDLFLTLNPGATYYKYYTYSTDPDTGEQISTENILQTAAESKYYIDNITANGNININAEKGVSLVLDGTMQSGVTDQTVNIYSDIDPYSEDARYIASSDDSTVYLKDIVQPGGAVNINLNDATFEGSGKVSYVNGNTHITVNNFTSKNVNLQEINTNSNPDNGLYINGVKQQSYSNIELNGMGYDSGSVVVNSNNGGEVQLNGNIDNQSGTTEINGNNGVYNLGTNLIDSKNIILTMLNDTPIGTQENPIYTNGVVKATTGNNIYLFAPTLLSIDSLTGKDLYLVSNGDIQGDDASSMNIAGDNVMLQAAGSIQSVLNEAIKISADVVAAVSSNGNINLHNSKDTVVGAVGTLSGLQASGDITFSTDGTFTQAKGSNIVSDNGNVALNSAGNMNIDYVQSPKEISLESQNGAITQDGDEDVDIVGDSLLAKAANGIGDDGVNEKYLDTDVNYIDAYNSAANNIDIRNDKSITASDIDGDGYALYNKNGDINILTDGAFTQQSATKISGQDVTINAKDDILLSDLQSKNAYITTLNGAISGDDASSMNIAGDNVMLQAAGSIQSVLNEAIKISADVVAAVSSNGNINLHNSKDTVVGAVGTLSGLQASGDITFSTDGTFTQAKGSNIVSDNGNVALNSAGNMNIDYVQSPKEISLESQNGAITQDGDEDVDIVGDSLLAKAANGIGDDGVNEKYLDTDVNYIDAYNSAANNIDIRNDKSITASDIDGDGYALYNKNGDINILTDGAFTQQSGSEILGANTYIDAKDDVLVSYIETKNAYITSEDGNIFPNEKLPYNIVASNDVLLTALNGIIGAPDTPLNVLSGGEVNVAALESKNLLSAYLISNLLPSDSFINLDLIVFNNRVISGTLIDMYNSTLFSVYHKLQNTTNPNADVKQKKENIINTEGKI
ncbi:hypothetical protein C3L23_08135 [Nautilia sp. PV-1]|uniref:beta strand repeat-containing protein n=1 Tax=Nautilia sp. PV-1 TaxID=2579250 RepID=UPI000FD9AE7B|nr:filamentous hemagglutinin N-terminal domain-containing protein [Nautilia sp. PV-1]AZV47243.1 hypothetical protein C3L23_08135 [Nautilia sp. PV-1]